MKKPYFFKAAPHCLVLVFAAMLLAVLPRTARAQDPPGRVARLSIIEGSVSVQPAGTQDWLDGNPNRPLTTGDGIWVGDNSRSEMHCGSAAIRLAADTGISFLNLDDQVLQIQLAQGTATIRVLYLNPNEVYEVDTPNLAFTVTHTGEYRISVDPDGNTTRIIPWYGSAEVTGGGTAYSFLAGPEQIFSGTGPLSPDVGPQPPREDFDQWSFSLDRAEDASTSARYISREVTGYEDLDRYGTWRDDPEYGHVWVPSQVEAGWAPYHRGHWVNIAPWGWTWVDAQPWGFAPFHYGRWAYSRGAWVWVPGSVAIVVGRPPVRPYYAPALVAFVGGGRFSLSLSIGGGAGVAWFPLGPRDVWVPAYHCSPRYMQNVNISNSTVIQRTQITNVYNTTVVNNVHVTNITYANQNAPGAVMAVSREGFVSGRPVAQSALRVSPQEIQHARVADARPIAPSEARAVPAASKPASIRPPASIANRPIVTKVKPAPQVVPIGHREAIAKSSLVKVAPPATPKPAPPPSRAVAPARVVAPPAKPGPAGTPAKPVAPAARSAPEGAPAKPVAPAAKPAPAEAPAKPGPPTRPETRMPARPATPEARPETKPAAKPVTPEASKPAPPPVRPEARMPAKPAPQEAKKPAKPPNEASKKTKKTEKQ